MKILELCPSLYSVYWLRKAIRLKDESYCLKAENTFESSQPNIKLRAELLFTSAEASFLRYFQEFNPYDEDVTTIILKPISHMMDYVSDLDSCYLHERLTYYLLGVSLYAVDESFINLLNMWIDVFKTRGTCDCIENAIAELSCEIAFMTGSQTLYFIYSKRLSRKNRRNVAKFRAMYSFRTFDSFQVKVNNLGSLTAYESRLPLQMEHSRHFAMKKNRKLDVITL